MSWLSSLFKKRSAPQQQASASSDNSEALIREQMALQKKYQMELDFRSSREAAEAAQPISEARREGFLGANSLLSAGGMGGWSHNGVSQGPRTNTNSSKYQMQAWSPQQAAKAAGAIEPEIQYWMGSTNQVMGQETSMQTAGIFSSAGPGGPPKLATNDYFDAARMMGGMRKQTSTDVWGTWKPPV